MPRNNSLLLKLSILGYAILQLSGCGLSLKSGSVDGPPSKDVDVSRISCPIPKKEPLCRYGNPPSYRVNGNHYTPLKTSLGYEETGIASWYGMKFHDRLTSCREPYSIYKMTAAHTTLPLPTYVKVTNLENGLQIIVRVNDRGPFEKNRVIDLSYVAAKKLGILAKGTGLVRVTAIDPKDKEEMSTKQLNITPDKKPKLYLQIGAFKQLSNAENLVTRMNTTLPHVPCRLYSGYNSNKEIIHRVQIGPIKDVETVDKLTRQLQINENIKAHAVVK